MKKTNINIRTTEELKTDLIELTKKNTPKGEMPNFSGYVEGVLIKHVEENKSGSD